MKISHNTRWRACQPSRFPLSFRTSITWWRSIFPKGTDPDIRDRSKSGHTRERSCRIPSRLFPVACKCCLGRWRSLAARTKAFWQIWFLHNGYETSTSQHGRNEMDDIDEIDFNTTSVDENTAISGANWVLRSRQIRYWSPLHTIK